ncbi:Crp/Fnr family transcriptional regulator [Thermovibrio ammonificans]|jgi:CRP-like cAMP-binding protein|uniref:Transcriptional regulator, Crp/Fnr family n=1 Tax=Thermovibrio ammonificans (strain DSM 15698 / JCM 12110 / HB-1) TaxID=648996 RepID=E8T6C1_THEA1|nr:cyclic nucleotide-binding domain-containing protein [Thermovibrio ammonificans]ADU96705.1 putative transcriptional regulator, Crp/Fnr family [Thermovibrio ammonificans HB-1]
MVKVELAKEFPLFENFTEKELKEIAEYLDYKVFPKGEVLFEEGDPGDKIFFIVKGRVGLYRPDPFGNPVKVAVSDEGTPLGELSFFSNRLHSSKGVALKETHALILTKEGYEKLKEQDPHLAVKLLEEIARVIAERLKEMNKKFVDTTCFIWGGPKK